MEVTLTLMRSFRYQCFKPPTPFLTDPCTAYFLHFSFLYAHTPPGRVACGLFFGVG